jgi:hypothetical protein
MSDEVFSASELNISESDWEHTPASVHVHRLDCVSRGPVESFQMRWLKVSLVTD